MTSGNWAAHYTPAEQAAMDAQLAAMLAEARELTPAPASPLRCGACYDCRTPGQLEPGEMCDVMDSDANVRVAFQMVNLAQDNTRALALCAADALAAAEQSRQDSMEAAEALYFARQAAEGARTRGGVALTATGYVQFPPAESHSAPRAPAGAPGTPLSNAPAGTGTKALCMVQMPSGARCVMLAGHDPDEIPHRDAIGVLYEAGHDTSDGK